MQSWAFRWSTIKSYPDVGFRRFTHGSVPSPSHPPILGKDPCLLTRQIPIPIWVCRIPIVFSLFTPSSTPHCDSLLFWTIHHVSFIFLIYTTGLFFGHVHRPFWNQLFIFLFVFISLLLISVLSTRICVLFSLCIAVLCTAF